MKKIPGLERTEVRIFLITFFLSLFAFLLMFVVALPLIFEQRLLSSRFSSSYVFNFFYGMILYFFAIGMLSALVYIFVRNMNLETKVFIAVLIATFFVGLWGIMGVVFTVGLYRGEPAHPLWVIGWLAVLGVNDNTAYGVRMYILFWFALSALIAGMLTLTYKARLILKKRRTAK